VHRRVALACCVLCAVALAGACNGDGSEKAAATTTTAAPTTSTTVAKGSWKTPLEAANNLMTAWKNSDGDAGRRSASEEAVVTLFGKTSAQYQARGCSTPNQLGSDCNYRLAGAGGVRLHLVADPVAGFLVDKVTFID
jgi:hypothetical protein